MIYTLTDLLTRVPALQNCKGDIEDAANILVTAFNNGNKLLICGNGGSAADSEHISGELLKGFLSRRPLTEDTISEYKKKSPLFTEEDANNLQYGLPAIPLTSLQALSTAFANDVNAEYIFAQGVMALGNKEDVLIAISTSGNSKNCFQAAKVAKGRGLKVIALTGQGGGKLSEIADVTIKVPETETFKIQELHIAVYHYLCAYCEKVIF